MGSPNKGLTARRGCCCSPAGEALQGNGIWEIGEDIRREKPQDLLANTGARGSAYGLLVTNSKASCDVLLARICGLEKVFFFRLN